MLRHIKLDIDSGVLLNPGEVVVWDKSEHTWVQRSAARLHTPRNYSDNHTVKYKWSACKIKLSVEPVINSLQHQTFNESSKRVACSLTLMRYARRFMN